MKALIWYGAMAVVVTVAGQNEIHNGSSSSSSYIQNSKLVGRKVKSSEGKEIGVIKDVVIDSSNGCMAYTVLSTGGGGTGVISGGGKIVAVPWAVYSRMSDLSVLTVNVDRDKIYSAPAFDYTRMDEYARPDYMNNVYSYYGVSSGPRTAVSGSSGAAASPYGASSVKPSPKTIPSGIGTRPPMGRGETESPTTTEEFPSVSTTSPSENKKSRRKAIEETSTRTPSATPQSAEGED